MVNAREVKVINPGQHHAVFLLDDWHVQEINRIAKKKNLTTSALARSVFTDYIMAEEEKENVDNKNKPSDAKPKQILISHEPLH